ncbi:MAG: DctP family TRAP transporter solute-binding subunit [Candidatus Omnitrophica bacterium]|nr:DctP family TRAP transporter solute-binding subunit [Candidatus Omnitrophota bacterium]
MNTISLQEMDKKDEVMEQNRRKSKWRRIPVLCSLFLLSLVFHHCGPAGHVSQITFSHILTDQSEWHAGAAKWKELVEEKLGEQMKIRLVTTSSLSKNNQRTELEMVQSGTLGGSWESSILLTMADPKWTVWSLPWLFNSYEDAEQVCESELGEEMLQSLEEKGIVGLGYGFNGFRRLTNSKRPVATVKDIQNLKIRVPSIQMYISLFRAWGADPSSMNFGDLIAVMRVGGMDGQENPLHVIDSRGLYELQKYLTLWEYSFDPIIFCLSRQVWDRLTPEVQEVLRDAAREACRHQRQIVVENEKKHLETLRAHGMEITIPSQESIAEFKKLAQSVYDEYEPVIGKELLDKFIHRSAAISSNSGGAPAPGS